MSIAFPDRAPPARWPWIDRKIPALVVAATLGFLSFAAVAGMTRECSKEPIYRATSDGLRSTSQDGARVVNGKHLRCRLT